MTVAQGTPRTDQHVATAYVVWRDAGEWVKADFCRELERELEEQKQSSCFWKAFADPPDMKTGKTTRDELSAQVVELQQQVAALHLLRGRHLVHSTVTRASVPPSVSDGGMTQRLVWLIERDSPAKWLRSGWLECMADESWTTDANEAVTFLSKKDAEEYVAYWYRNVLERDRPSVTEHAFITAPIK